jgi:hypothetical protein
MSRDNGVAGKEEQVMAGGRGAGGSAGVSRRYHQPRSAPPFMGRHREQPMSATDHASAEISSRGVVSNLRRLHDVLSTINNLLVIPLFTVMVLETSAWMTRDQVVSFERMVRRDATGVSSLSGEDASAARCASPTGGSPVPVGVGAPGVSVRWTAGATSM